MKNILHILCFSLLFSNAFGQNFSNNDLNGTVIGLGNLPTNWQNVPLSDPVCNASSLGRDTPDLSNTTLPNAALGNAGIAYSGSTFVSGLSMFNTNGPSIFHEGIMQTVNGFVVGFTYTIHFQQSVVKQANAIDTSGSWSVYVNSTLAGTTIPSVSQDSFNNLALKWSARSISFVATSTVHTIKFLPKDDDSNQTDSSVDSAGALRMGIDSIYIGSLCTSPPNISMGPDTIICVGDSVQLSVGIFNTYLWSPASALSCTTCATPVAFTTNGVQINVEVVDSFGCTASDSMQIEIERVSLDLGVDTVICAGETIVLNAQNPGKTYVWQDGSTNSTFSVMNAGTYWVTVTSARGCSSTDTIIITTCVGNTIQLEAEMFRLYPNPFTSQLNISQKKAGQFKVEILDQLGRIVKREVAFTKEINIDTGTLPSGIYFLRVQAGDQMITRKIIKQ